MTEAEAADTAPNSFEFVRLEGDFSVVGAAFCEDSVGPASETKAAGFVDAADSDCASGSGESLADSEVGEAPSASLLNVKLVPSSPGVMKALCMTPLGVAKS